MSGMGHRLHAKWVFGAGFSLLAAVIVAAGVVYYQSYKEHFRFEAERQLSAVAALKTAELVQWRKERLGDGNIFSRNPAFSVLVRRLQDAPEDEDARRQIQTWMGKLQTFGQYDQVRLLDTRAVARLSTSAEVEPISAEITREALEVLRSGEVSFCDFYRSDHNQRVYLSVMAPVFDAVNPARPLGVLILRIDPTTYLYPFVSRWPTSSETAESLLVRRDGNDVLFLSELKFLGHAAFALRLPLTRTDVPAVKAVLGQTGIVEGRDYRDVPVFADLRDVPNSPWFLVTRLDTTEAFAPLRERLWATVLLVGALVFGAGTGVGYLWRRQRVHFYRERYEVAEALRESERFLRESQSVARIGSYAFNIAEGTWKSSGALDEIFGIDATFVRSVDGWTALIHPAWRKTMIDHLRIDVVANHARFDKEYQIIRQRDGVERWVHGLGELEFDAQHQHMRMVGTIQDITERKRVEAVLQESEKLYRSLFDRMLNGFAYCQVLFEGDRPQDFIYLAVNPAFGALTGLKDVIGRKVSEVIPGILETDPVLIERYGRVARTGVSETFEIWVEALNMWFAISVYCPRPDHFVAVFDVVTQRKRAEAELQESEQKFRTLFEHMTEGVALHEIVSDAQGHAVDYRILTVNPAYERHTGLPVAQAHGQLASVLYGSVPPPYFDEYERVVRTGEPYAFEAFFPPLEKSFRIGIISPKRGQFATVFEDITMRKRQERELQDKNSELERFTYTVSHDLKSPLITIKGFAGALLLDVAAGRHHRLEGDLRRIADAADKMGHLLTDLLELSRVGRIAQPPFEVNLDHLVRDILHLLAGPIAQRQAEIVVQPGLSVVWADRQRLAEVWQNLIENALKFSGDRPHIEIGARAAEQATVFFVRDNGVGIDPRYHDTVFGLFNKLDTKTEGTGIGLALVRRIIEVHGGQIWVESDGVGRGATFCFTLPPPNPLRQPA